MSQFIQGTGDKVKVYVQLLPYGDRYIPIPVDLGTITGDAGDDFITASAVAFDTATGNLPPGTQATDYTNRKLCLSSGTPIKLIWLNTETPAQEFEFITTIRGHETTDLAGNTVEKPDVKKGTSVKIFLNDPLPSEGTLKTTTAYEIPKNFRIFGGTSTGISINNEKTETYVFESKDGFSDGLVTTANWEMPFTANLIANDLALFALTQGAALGVLGKEVYVWFESAPPKGYSKGVTKHGTAVITAFTEDDPSDGILTYNLTFSGQGGLKIETFQV